VLLKLRLPEDSGQAGWEEKKDNPLLDVRAIKHQSEKRVQFGPEEQEIEAAYNKHIPAIMEMGFSRESAIRALTNARGNVERAIESLLAS
jgi:NACalpha-BTF3-like transcription factor